MANKNKELTQELVKHLRENRESLRRQWIKEMTAKKLLEGLTPQEVETESEAIYDTCIDCLKTGGYEGAKKYARAMAEKGVLQGMTTEQIISGMLTLRDIYGRSLCRKYAELIKVGEVLSIYEPVANRILSIVAMAFVEEKTKDLEDMKVYVEGIFEAMPDGMVIISPEGIMTNVNRAVEELTGYSKDELMGAKLNKVIVRRDWEKNENKLKESWEKGYVKNLEVTLLTKGKREIPVMINVRLAKDARGKSMAVVPVIRDMRQTKKLILELEQAKAKLEERVRGRTQELQGKVEDLERFNRLAVDRELKMVELKKKIKELEAKLRELRK